VRRRTSKETKWLDDSHTTQSLQITYLDHSLLSIVPKNDVLLWHHRWGLRTTFDLWSPSSGVDPPKSPPSLPPVKLNRRVRGSNWLNTGVSTKRVKPVLIHLLKSGASKIHPIKVMTTTGKPFPTHWRSTSTTRRDAWSVMPLKLKTATTPILVSTMRWRVSNKVNTIKLNTPTKKKLQRSQLSTIERMPSERSQMTTKSQGKLLKPNFHQKVKLPLNQSQLASKI
jgi:hypothetical protein